jgi:hypothetical protein
MIARLPVQPNLSTYQRLEIPILERRWTDVMNLRQILQKTGCDVQDPMIPKTHMPLGCVVARFRHLRSAVWGTEPVVLDRTMRLNCKGSLRIELDFRPRFFKAVDPLKAHKKTEMKEEEEWEPRTPRAADLEETAESVALEERRNKKLEEAAHNIVLTGAGGDSIMGGRQHMQQNPVEMYQKYKQVDVWVKQVLKARKKQMNEEVGIDDKDGITMIKSQIAAYKKRHELWREKREQRKEDLDKSVKAVAVTQGVMKKPVEQSKQDDPKKPKVEYGGIPEIRVEPWLEEILEGTRFV